MNILHKLGLYRASEIDELIAKTAALTNSVDGVIDGAKLDRQCYKAAISAFREVNTVEYAVKVISDYCASTICYDCDYANGECMFANTPPCAWEVSK